jgi:membrane protease YdiL (CAAX protease family)
MIQNTKEWMSKHPLPAFFIFAIAICFATLFPAIYLIPHGASVWSILGFYIGKIGVYSPVIAGIFVTKVILPGRHHVSFSRRLKYSLPVWIAALFISAADLRLTAPPSVPLTGLIILSIPVSLLPAWVVSSAFAGSDSVRNMLKTLVKPKGSFIYYVIALLTFPVIHLAGAVITNLIDSRTLLPDMSGVADLFYTLIITFFFVIFFAGGINEESGWRGFAQKRLQAKFSPLASAVILWSLMVVWHIPNDIIQYQNGGYIMVRIVLYVFITILFIWIYNRTNGSILAVVVFHASMNSMNPLMGIFPITTAGNVLLIGFAIVVIITDRMWSKLPENHPAVYQDIADHFPEPVTN